MKIERKIMNRILFKLLFACFLFTFNAHAMQQSENEPTNIDKKSPSNSPTPDNISWLERINADFQIIKTKTRAYSLQTKHTDIYSKSHARLMNALKTTPDVDANIPAQFVQGYKRKIECLNKGESIASISYTIAIPNKYSVFSQENVDIIISDLTVIQKEPFYPEQELHDLLLCLALEDAAQIHINDKINDKKLLVAKIKDKRIREIYKRLVENKDIIDLSVFSSGMIPKIIKNINIYSFNERLAKAFSSRAEEDSDEED